MGSPGSGFAIVQLVRLLIIGLGLAVIALSAYQGWKNFSAHRALQQAESEARRQATELGDRLSRIQNVLADAVVVSRARAVLEGRSDLDQLHDIVRSRGVSNILELRVVPEPLAAPELGTHEESELALLEMLDTARREERAPARVHLAGTGAEYLALAERLADGRQPEAALFLGLPVGLVTDRLHPSDKLDYIALLQVPDEDPVVLQAHGSASLEVTERIGVPGTWFEIAWYRSTAAGLLGNREVGVAVAAGLFLVLLGRLIRHRSGRVRRPAATPAPPASPFRARAESGFRPPSGPPKREPAPPEPEEPPAERAPVAADTVDMSTLGDEAAAEPGPGPEDPRTPDEEPVPGALEEEDEEISRLLSDLAEEQEQAPAEPPPEARRDHPGTESGPGVPAQSGPGAPAQSSAGQSEADDSRQAEAAQTGPDEPDTPASDIGDADKPTASIFRAYDIRGVVGGTLSAPVAEWIGRAVGTEARARGVERIAIARDGRLSGTELLAAAGRGLVSSGLEVIEVGAVPTPVLYYAACELAGGSGMMVTGSHNPPEYNGFKIMLAGETLSGQAIEALHRRIERGDLVKGKGTLHERNIAEQYLERVATDIQLARPLKVVADCGNGIAGLLAPKLLSEIGAEVIPLYAEVDGTFPNHHPDPSDPDNLEDLKLCVSRFQADLGVAFDGDGDRLGVVAPDGEIIWPDRLMVLFSRDVLSRNPGAPIIFDVKCSGQLIREIEAAGGRPVMARTGHSFIKERMKAEGAPLAGEMSGHFFFSERWYGFDDGLYAAARLLEILAADSRPVGRILADLPRAASTPELKVGMAEGETHAFVEAFREAAEFGEARITTIDGLRADYADAWGLLRASNTTPVLVLRFEGDDQAALERIQAEFREQMLAIDPGLELPF